MHRPWVREQAVLLLLLLVLMAELLVLLLLAAPPVPLKFHECGTPCVASTSNRQPTFHWGCSIAKLNAAGNGYK